MALIYKQTVVQEEQITPLPIAERFIVQYYDDVTEKDDQQFIEYNSLTVEEKATFDAFKTLCESKMV